MLKKSQLSIFIIIGILSIVVIASLIFILKKDLIFNPVQKSKDQVNEIVQSCLESITKQGVFLLGFKGGYIYLPPWLKNNPELTVNLGMTVPIWDSNTAPTINSMENQLNQYISNNLLSCVKNNLNHLNDIYNITIGNNATVNSKILEGAVTVDVRLPIRLQRRGTNEEAYLNEFSYKLNNVKLRAMYDLALDISKKEENTKFLENLVMEQIEGANYYDDVEHSMPSEGMFFSCSKKIWTYPLLKKTLVNLNNNNFKYLWFVGTAPLNVPKSETTYYKYKHYYDSFYTINLGTNLPESAKEFKVNVFVPSAETIKNYSLVDDFFTFKKFEVTPNNGGVVTSLDVNIGKFHFPIPCLQVFHHLYTLDYVMMIKITDEETGNIFQFPIRISIYRNNPYGKVISPLPEAQDNYNNFAKSEFCSENETVIKRNYTINGKTKEVTEVIPPMRRYPLKVIVRDRNNNFIDGAKISEECVGFKCNVGETEYPTYMGIKRVWALPYLISNFSECYNAKIVAKKKGYWPNYIFKTIDNKLLKRTEPETAVIILDKVKKFKLGRGSVLLKNYETGESWRLGPGEMVYITVRSAYKDFSSTGVYPIKYAPLESLSFLVNPDVKYNLTAYYISKNYKLKGLKILTNWKPRSYEGSMFYITIPAVRGNVSESQYPQLYNYFEMYSNKDLPAFY